jgi:hypothetical protein
MKRKKLPSKEGAAAGQKVQYFLLDLSTGDKDDKAFGTLHAVVSSQVKNSGGQKIKINRNNHIVLEDN